MEHSSFRRDGHSLKTWRSTETHQEIRLKGCKPCNTPWSLSGCWPLNHYYKSPHHIPLGSDKQFWGYEPAVSPFAQQSNKAIFCVVQSPSQVLLFVTPWTAVLHASLSSPSPGVCPSSFPLHWWCYLAISSSDALSCFSPQSFPASGTFPMSQLFALGSQNTGVSASASVLSTSIQVDFP